MSLLSDHAWKVRYSPEDGDLVRGFYVPALRCAVRYDRTTGYFAATALTLAMRGIEGLLRNDGHMRLLVGCTLDEAEVEAIARGEALKATVERRLLATPLVPCDDDEIEALELLAWLVANGRLAVKVAVPCDAARKPIGGAAIFHEKSGILEDKTGDRLAFAGSINETAAGWRHNWEAFHVYTSWSGTLDHVEVEEKSFATLWADRAERARVLDVPAAAREDLLRFLPKDGPPMRLREPEPAPPSETPTHLPEPEANVASDRAPSVLPPLGDALRRRVWSFIAVAPTLPRGGERVGEATANVEPWPHQVRAFERMYENWPPRLLIADEVGLGKTIEAGMLLRQAWLAGRAKRILILAPRAVLRQWQIELREKFNLNWPIYDGQSLHWWPCAGLGHAAEQPVSRADWHKTPCVLASSQLMRRADRAPELLEHAEPWDLVVLDEAHHARRRGAAASKERPNLLLRLMRGLSARTQGLLLLTATPMQVDPVEVWDLLDLLGLPSEWNADAFLRYFAEAESPTPSHEAFERLAALFRVAERTWGEASPESAARHVPGGSTFAARKLLRALRDVAATPRRMLSATERSSALAILRAGSPVSHLVSRHTRELLRRYHKAGLLSTRIADRQVDDDFVTMSEAERVAYEAVEDYISSAWDAASPDKRNAVGFVMTVYRRRVASSFAALRRTLEERLRALRGGPGTPSAVSEDDVDADALDDPTDAEEAEALAAAVVDERAAIEDLLHQVKALPVDTKATFLVEVLGALRAEGYAQVMVFTQYADTMAFLREELCAHTDLTVLCFSGRGGEIRTQSGAWRTVNRDEVKRLFREGRADVLLCTDAAAEGLNFQFCGALVNYDMPWNPMRVEQRIGRIDRLGQRHETIRIVNLHYAGTVESDIYRALRSRIALFQSFVGRLQPILAKLPRRIADATFKQKGERERETHAILSDLQQEIAAAETGGFDLDGAAEADLKEPARPPATCDLGALDTVLQRADLLPPGTVVRGLAPREYGLRAPGMNAELRVTTDAAYFEEHPESVELWSPGSPLFPAVEEGEIDREGVAGLRTLTDALTAPNELAR